MVNKIKMWLPKAYGSASHAVEITQLWINICLNGLRQIELGAVFYSDNSMLMLKQLHACYLYPMVNVEKSPLHDNRWHNDKLR